MSGAAFGGENAESYYDEGLTAAVKGDLNRAAQFFEKAIRLDSTMATAYHQLGKCYARLGRHKKAIALLSQVVDKRPDLLAARLDLGYALNGIKEFGGAQRQFHDVLHAEPGNSKALLGLAESEALQGRWTEALTFAKSAQQTGGANFPVLFMLGEAAKHAGESDLSVKSLQKADKLLEKYLETNPGKPEGHFLRGKVAAAMENYPAALQHLREAETRAESGRSYLAYGESFTLADVLARQAECLGRLGRTPLLQELRDRIAALDPEHPAVKAANEG
jgi:tetratricopeptide (TPR) repeat protein